MRFSQELVELTRRKYAEFKNNKDRQKNSYQDIISINLASNALQEKPDNVERLSNFLANAYALKIKIKDNKEVDTEEFQKVYEDTLKENGIDIEQFEEAFGLNRNYTYEDISAKATEYGIKYDGQINFDELVEMSENSEANFNNSSVDMLKSSILRAGKNFRGIKNEIDIFLGLKGEDDEIDQSEEEESLESNGNDIFDSKDVAKRELETKVYDFKAYATGAMLAYNRIQSIYNSKEAELKDKVHDDSQLQEFEKISKAKNETYTFIKETFGFSDKEMDKYNKTIDEFRLEDEEYKEMKVGATQIASDYSKTKDFYGDITKYADAVMRKDVQNRMDAMERDIKGKDGKSLSIAEKDEFLTAKEKQNCLGIYSLVRKQNEGRSAWNKFFHPFANRKEQKLLSSLEDKLADFDIDKKDLDVMYSKLHNRNNVSIENIADKSYSVKNDLDMVQDRVAIPGLANETSMEKGEKVNIPSNKEKVVNIVKNKDI